MSGMDIWQCHISTPSLTRFWDASLAEWNDTRYETYDSGELISSVRRYGIWNMIRGSWLGVLDDMRHDSENVLSLFLSISISFCQLSWEPDEIPTHTNARKLQTLVPLFLSILLFLFYLDVGSAPLFLGGYVVVLDGMVWIWSVWQDSKINKTQRIPSTPPNRLALNSPSV